MTEKSRQTALFVTILRDLFVRDGHVKQIGVANAQPSNKTFFPLAWQIFALSDD